MQNVAVYDVETDAGNANFSLLHALLLDLELNQFRKFFVLQADAVAWSLSVVEKYIGSHLRQSYSIRLAWLKYIVIYFWMFLMLISTQLYEASRLLVINW